MILRCLGGPEVLEVVDVEPPTSSELRRGEPIVRSSAFGLNPVDHKSRAGLVALPASRSRERMVPAMTSPLLGMKLLRSGPHRLATPEGDQS